MITMYAPRHKHETIAPLTDYDAAPLVDCVGDPDPLDLVCLTDPGVTCPRCWPSIYPEDSAKHRSTS